MDGEYPAVADASGTTARIAASLGDDAAPAGLTAGAEAVMVRRAIARASGWRDHDWRLVRGAPQDPALHMALDEVLAREVAAGRRPPTLRIWEWSAPAFVIGSFQSLRNEVDAAQARRHGMTVVRRISGGAMFIDPASTITYSLYAPGSLVAGMSLAESYRYLDDWVIGTLTEDLGLSAWHEPLNDIASARGKIGGAAQRRLAGGTVLHHVTMAYDIDAGAMTRVLRAGREKLSDKGIPSAVKQVDPLRRQTRLPRAKVIDLLAGHFRRRYGFSADTVTSGELRAARDLARAKFASSQWTARVP
jgi:lipoate---protein ligase